MADESVAVMSRFSVSRIRRAWRRRSIRCRCHVAGVVASEAGFAEGAEEVAEGFEAEEVKALVGDFELGLLLRVPDLSADAGAFRRVVRLIDGYVIFLLQALDQLLDEIFEFAVHLHLLEAVAHFFVEGFSIEEGLLDGAAEFVKSLLAFGEFVPELSLNPLCRR